MTLPEAQSLITAMLKECGLSRVIITHDGEHNRYSKRGDNGWLTIETICHQTG